MRILIIHNILWAHYKSSVFQALQQLVDKQVNVHLNVLQISRNERSRADLEITDNASTPGYIYNYELLFDRFLQDVSLRDRASSLWQRARAFRPDIITLTGYYDPAQILLLLWAKKNGIRVVMQNESTAADHRQGGWKEQFKRWIFKQCDGFFCFGTQSANYLLQLGVRPDKILLRKNAVDNDALRSAYEQALPNRIRDQQRLGVQPNNFVFVGRLIAFKNVQALLSAFADAQKQSGQAKNWGLILLGDGPEHGQLLQRASALGIADKVHFLPGRPWYQVPEVLALSNVLVLPSWSEPWGLVANEALACGLPVIVSNRCGCVPDLVKDEQNGFVFDPDMPAQLTSLLLRFINGKVDIKQMQETGQQSVIPYSPKAVAQGMLNGYFKISGLQPHKID